MSEETKRDDGGPAFPFDEFDVDGGHWEGRYEIHKQNCGMSLRDWFAGKVIQGLMANPNVVGFNANNGWSLVNCTTAQIADYAKHIGNQMVRATGNGEV